MKYLVRSVKYFVHLLVVLTLIILVLVCLKVIDPDISKMFRNGYDSLWQIALTMAAFAALYPKFGYTRMNVMVPGSFDEIYPVVKQVMENSGYVEETHDGENLTFRKRSPVTRAFKQWEDRVSFERIAAGFEIEGISKDLVHIKSAIADKYREE